MSGHPHVLIIDDDDWLAEQYVRTLGAAGYSATIAPHGLVAIDMIDTRRPDVIILDVFLPGPNGFVLLHELRSHADLAAIPVVLCTSSAEQLADEDVTAYGVDRVLDKATMTPDDLIAAVRRVLL